MTATCKTRLPSEVALGHGNILCLGSTTTNYPLTPKHRSFIFCPRSYNCTVAERGEGEGLASSCDEIPLHGGILL